MAKNFCFILVMVVQALIVRAANDSEFRQIWNSYYSKYEAARSQSDGWASSGGEQYMRTHGHPDFKISDTDLSGYYSENI